MVLEKIREKIAAKKKSSEEFVEVDESALKSEGHIDVRIEELRDFLDVERIQKLVREGNVVFLKIKGLRNKDISELKRSVEKLKKTCVAMNGDIVGIDEDFLIITPQFAKIFRGK